MTTDTSTLDELCESLRVLEAAATPGPWKDDGMDIFNLTDSSGKGYPLDRYPDSVDVECSGQDYDRGERYGILDEDDRALIVALRNALPLLLAERASARGEMERLDNELAKRCACRFDDGVAVTQCVYHKDYVDDLAANRAEILRLEDEDASVRLDSDRLRYALQDIADAEGSGAWAQAVARSALDRRRSDVEAIRVRCDFCGETRERFVCEPCAKGNLDQIDTLEAALREARAQSEKPL